MNSTSTSTGAVHQDPAITNLIRDGVSSDESVRGFYADRAWRLCGNGSNRAHLVYARSFQNITLSVDVPPMSVDVPPMSVDEAIHGRGRPPCCWWTYPLSTVDESTREGGHVRRRALVHGSGRTGGRAQRKLGSPLQTREPEMAARTRSKVTPKSIRTGTDEGLGIVLGAPLNSADSLRVSWPERRSRPAASAAGIQDAIAGPKLSHLVACSQGQSGLRVDARETPTG